MNDIELSRLAECETVIERGMKTFVDVGNALLEIRDSGLYRHGYETFEQYCRDRWGMSRIHAFRMIEAADVTRNLLPIGNILPATESQARPLTSLPAEQQREAWQRVIEKAPDGKITAALVLEAAKEIQQQRGEERRAERIERIIEISSGNKELPAAKKFNVIYADPPWKYEYSISTSREIENQYPTMDLADICNLPVSEIAGDDCVLFLWGTSPKLQEALTVIESWGFKYRTCAVWVKDKIGMGYYFRQQHELLLVATKGEMPAPAPSARVSSVIEGDRTSHSKKPDVVYDIIDGMYGMLPKIELFSRNTKEGWDAWGNQI